MRTDDMLSKLESFGITDKETYFSQAFSRNIGLFTEEEQARLSKSRIAIPGMGGVGGGHLITLTRTGITKFNIADFDTYEPANINRQYGARVPEFDRPKLEVMAEQALSINPYLELNRFKEGINESNMDDFLNGVDVVLDGLDFFQFEIRRLLFKRAAEKRIHVITAGPMGYSSAMLVFSPQGMGFDEYFNIRDGMADEDKYLSFALGLSPRPTHIKYMDFKKVDFSSKAGPSLDIACQICAGMAATEAVKVILKKGKIKPAPHYYQYDPFLQTLRKGYLFMGNRNLYQRLKIQVVKKFINRNKPKSPPEIPEKPERQPRLEETIENSVLEYLIRAGIQAPSGDNCQPWTFEIKKNRIDLFLDQDKDRSFFNVNQIASLISCGAVLENIKVAASQFGIRTAIDFNTDNAGDKPVATIHLFSDEIKPDPLADQIWQRHSNRKMYARVLVPPEIMSQITNSICETPEANLSIINDNATMKKVARIVFQADRIRTEFRPLHEHLMKMIRFSDKEAIKTKDGFPIKNLEAGIAGEIFLRLTKPWTMMNIANKVGLGRIVAFHAYQGLMRSSGIGLLTINGTTGDMFVKGGQALERMWLTMESLGMKMQPMTAVTLFNMRLKFGDKKKFLEKHLRRIESLQAEFERCFPESRNQAGQVMLFRFGYAEEIKCRTLRK